MLVGERIVCYREKFLMISVVEENEKKLFLDKVKTSQSNKSN